jgi:transcription elongation GreA/GreB family factor
MALLGHKEGDSISIDTPDGEAIFKVLKIKK